MEREWSKDMKFRARQAEKAMAYMRGGGSPEEAEALYPRYKTGLIFSIRDLSRIMWRTIKDIFTFKRFHRGIKERRRVLTICKSCDRYKDHRCKECNCVMPIATWLKEKSCPLGKWKVNGMVSVLLTTKDEPLLAKTIKSLEKNAKEEIEIIVEEDVNDDGRRVLLNKLANKANGDYLYIIDSHCTVPKNWDTMLKENCVEGTIVFSPIQSIDRDTLKPKKGLYTGAYLDINLEQKWGGEIKGDIGEAMCFTGCGWMIKKETYDKFNGCSLELGRWGGLGSEWALKIWLSGGRLLCDKRVPIGHVFTPKDTNPTHNVYQPEVDATYAKIREFTYQNNWYHQIHSIQWLVGKFWPVKSWINTLQGPERIEYINEYYA